MTHEDVAIRWPVARARGHNMAAWQGGYEIRWLRYPGRHGNDIRPALSRNPNSQITKNAGRILWRSSPRRLRARSSMPGRARSPELKTDN